MHIITFEQFANIMHRNMQTRSRTARGVSNISSSAEKQKLLKSDQELQIQVEDNTNKLIKIVWDDSCVRHLTPLTIRSLMEKWYDTINNNLVDPSVYKEKIEHLRLEAKELHIKTGLPYKINPRYRVWNLSYTSLNIAPIELEFAMDKFYDELNQKIVKAIAGSITKAEILAYADYSIDTAIHPWLDGCGRNATATVMWLALLVTPTTLPIFEHRDKHYEAINDLARHTAYYEKCLKIPEI